MKKLFTFFVTVSLTATLWAQSSEKMSYQAVIRNSSDVLVTNTQIGMEINIRQGSPTGIVVYTEAQTPITNANGLVSIEIGGGTGFNTIDWANGPYFIETKTALTPPLTTYTITGTSQLLSVPYALHAKTAETLTGGITETDPIFGASPANGITGTNVTDWNTAFGWGNHAAVGYLTSFSETDPIFSAWDKDYTDLINTPDLSGYLTSYTENDPFFTNNFDLSGSTTGNILKFDGTKFVPSNSLAGSGTANQIAFWNSASELSSSANLSWDATNSRLGIGTGLPSYTLTLGTSGSVFGVENASIFLAKNSVGGYEQYFWPRWVDNVMYMNYGFGGFNIRNNTFSSTMFLTNDRRVGIGTTTPQSSAILDVSSTNKGVIMPQIALTGINDATTISTPAVSLLIYNTATVNGVTPGYYYNAGTTIAPVWTRLTTTIADGSETIVTAGTNITITGNGTSASPYVVNQNSGTVAGQMLYWNGSAWVTVAAGLNGQVLRYKNGAPTWADGNINDLSIGDSYQGGIIAYFLQPGDPGYDANVKHGIIAAPSDQSTPWIQWGCYGTAITGADGTAIGTGYQNTLDIVNGCSTADIAAKICYDLVLGGFSDWYLPSKDELYKLYINRTAVGGFADTYYWSSTEASNNYAWGQFYGNGGQATYYRYNSANVRAVRAF